MERGILLVKHLGAMHKFLCLLVPNLVHSSTSVAPMFQDPREDPACASMFGDPSPWRAWDAHFNGSLDVITVRLFSNSSTNDQNRELGRRGTSHIRCEGANLWGALSR